MSWANGTLVLGALLALRLVEAGIFCLLLRSSLLSFRKTVLFLMIGAGIQFVLGVFQVLLGHSLGLTWFGEPSIATDMVGVAKRNLAADVKQLRAYGTFLHANIFAAYILIVYWVGKFTHGASPKTQNFASLQGAGPPLFFLVAVLGLYFAFSWAAFAMFLGGVVFVFLFQEIKSSTIQRRTMCGLFGLLIVLNMGMIFWQQDVHLPSVKERLEQIQISRSMIVDHPFGVGVGGYTLHMQDYASRRLSPWEFQPVHNVYFLVLNELGIQGLILFLFFFGYYVYRSFFRAPIGSAAVDPYKFVLFFSVLVLASVDHFFWDSWVGLMLATLALLLFKINYYKIQN
ncbi:O-antigen ligase family protein [Candidatus Peregrinibacteria bacterium]|nr:O-antigen ligase family protein [Candidatus Peregrinibacteria bacterium]